MTQRSRASVHSKNSAAGVKDKRRGSQFARKPTLNQLSQKVQMMRAETMKQKKFSPEFAHRDMSKTGTQLSQRYKKDLVRAMNFFAKPDPVEKRMTDSAREYSRRLKGFLFTKRSKPSIDVKSVREIHNAHEKRQRNSLNSSQKINMRAH